MAMVPFSSQFSDIALKEARRIDIKDRNNIPDGTYLFLDAYCDELHCDCQSMTEK